MATIYDIKKRADDLSEKKEIDSISPAEVGGLIRDLADYTGEVETDGGTLGIRKTYTSIEEMKADEIPIGFDGKPLKRGNLVVISNEKNTGKEYNQVYVFQKPGWELMYKVDAGYATRIELEKLADRDVVMSEDEYEKLPVKNPDAFYYTYEEEE